MTKQTINNAIKQSEDLKIIQHSLFYACCVKYKEKQITIEKEKLIGRIMDSCNVNSAKANEYLKILISRNTITLDGDLVYYKRDGINTEDVLKI